MSAIVYNKAAKFHYQLLTSYEVGIVLTGSEIKSIRNKQVQIKEAYGLVRNGEVFILNMHIAHYKNNTGKTLDPTRTRKLLLNKSQINKIIRLKKTERITLVPTKVYIKNGVAKLQIFIAKGKKQFDKREVIKKRDEKRAAKRMEKYKK